MRYDEDNYSNDPNGYKGNGFYSDRAFEDQLPDSSPNYNIPDGYVEGEVSEGFPKSEPDPDSPYIADHDYPEEEAQYGDPRLSFRRRNSQNRR